MLTWINSARKAIVTLLGGLLTVLTAVNAFHVILPASVSGLVATGVALVTTALTWLVPNKTPAS